MHELALSRAESKSLSQLFLEGAVSNMSNPKIAVFYFAFFPQFGLGVKLALERRP